MTVPYKRDESNYRYLTNRFGTIDTSPELNVNAAERLAVADLEPLLHQETSFIVRRVDGTFGLLMEVVEFGHDEQHVVDDEETLQHLKGRFFNGTFCDGTNLPKRTDVVAELQVQADEIAKEFPSLELEVATDDDAFYGRAVIRAFIPQGSPLMGDIPMIADRMHSVYDKTSAYGPESIEVLEGLFPKI